MLVIPLRIDIVSPLYILNIQKGVILVIKMTNNIQNNIINR